MKAIISSEEYDDYLKQVFNKNSLRFCIVSALFYFLVSIISDLISNGLVQAFLLKNVIINLGTSALWGVLFIAMFLPLMRSAMKGITKNIIGNIGEKNENEKYKVYIPCSFKKSRINSIGGLLYIGENDLYFKPHRLNIRGTEIKWHDVDDFIVNIEKQSVSIFTKMLFKYIPECLVIKSVKEDKMARFIVPYPNKVIEALVAEGILSR